MSALEIETLANLLLEFPRHLSCLYPLLHGSQLELHLLPGRAPDQKIRLDQSPELDEVILKNLPPSSSLIEDIGEHVKGFLVSKTLMLKGDSSTASRSLSHIRWKRAWRIVGTMLSLFENLFVSIAIRMLRKQASKAVGKVNWKQKVEAIVPAADQKLNFLWKWGIGKFVLAYVDGRLCRYIPNPIARRIETQMFRQVVPEFLTYIPEVQPYSTAVEDFRDATNADDGAQGKS
ncbi:unnamed protein product [Withania somnifera]